MLNKIVNGITKGGYVVFDHNLEECVFYDSKLLYRY